MEYPFGNKIELLMSEPREASEAISDERLIELYRRADHDEGLGELLDEYQRLRAVLAQRTEALRLACRWGLMTGAPAEEIDKFVEHFVGRAALLAEGEEV